MIINHADWRDAKTTAASGMSHDLVSELLLLATNFDKGSAERFQLERAAQEIRRMRQSLRAFHADQRRYLNQWGGGK